MNIKASVTASPWYISQFAFFKKEKKMMPSIIIGYIKMASLEYINSPFSKYP